MLPTTVAILIALFSIQSRGSGTIGRAFGPVMVLWFAVMRSSASGAYGTPAVLLALDPRLAIACCPRRHARFAVLGGVFLCVTGAEALYADMGHSAPNPFGLPGMQSYFQAWSNYTGQAAIVLTEGVTADKSSTGFAHRHRCS